MVAGEAQSKYTTSQIGELQLERLKVGLDSGVLAISHKNDGQIFYFSLVGVKEFLTDQIEASHEFCTTSNLHIFYE